MRAKRKMLLTTAFAALLGVGAFAGVSLIKEAVKPAEVEAVVINGKYRINVLTNSANWLQDNVNTVFNPAGSNVAMSRDTDFTQSSTNSSYSTVTIGSTTYNWQTYELSNKSGITKNENYWFGRGNASSNYNWFDSGINLYTQFRSNNWDNTIIISGSWDNWSASTYGWYVKVELHTGLNLGTTSYEFMNSAGTPSNTNTPSGYIFKGWYTNSDLTTAWTSGSQFTDIKLYAKYEIEPSTGYYMVGDAAFISEFGTTGDAFEFNSGVLMNSATGGNKAVYTFTNSSTITFKSRYYSHDSNWWVSNTEMSEEASTHSASFDKDGNYVVPAGTWSLYVFVKNNEDTSSLTWGMPLDSYCSEFMTRTGAVCAGSSTSESALAAVWSILSTDWTKLSTDDQNTLKSATASETGTDVQKVMARYDVIIHNHTSFSDYMGRKSNANYTYKNAAFISSIISENSGSTIAIIAISATSLAAVGGYFLFRKKKEN